MLRIAANGQCCGLLRSATNGRNRLVNARQASGGGGGGGGGRTTFYLISATAITTGATTLAAKYDPDFRAWLAKNAPYSVPFLRIALQEGKPINEELLDVFYSAKEALLDTLFKKKELPKSSVKEVVKKDDPCKDLKKAPEYRPPHPVFSQLLDEPIKELAWKEIRIVTENDGDALIVTTEKAAEGLGLPDTHPRSLAELETKIASVATESINNYHKAYCAVREHAIQLHKVIDSTPDQVTSKTWDSLRDKTLERETLVKEAEAQGQLAASELGRLQKLLAQDNKDAPKDLVDQAQRNAQGMLADMKEAREKLQAEKTKASVTDKYWQQVQEARQHYNEEMQILFPNINLSQRKLNLDQDELDLFILHAFHNVLFYQKQLKKIETLGENQLKAALSSTAGEPGLVEACVQIALEKDMRDKDLDFQKKALCVRAQAERELRQLMKRQAAAHQDHLQDALNQKEMETERRMRREMDELIAKETACHKVELAAMVGRMKGMDAALQDRAELDRASASSQALWAACQALYAALRAAAPGTPWREQLTPLEPQVDAVKRAAADNDQLVAAVVASIPPEAVSRGVYTEEALRERFLKVERVARQVALVPEGGGRIPLFLLSYLQSFLLVRAVSPIPQAELRDQPVDLDQLDTYDLLQRARYWLDRGDFAMVLRYMHLLGGASRRVACDWMDEARILLETQQAATVLMSHAAASGLML